MTSIRSFSDILREGVTSDAEHEKYAGIIYDEAVRLTRLLDDLLDLSVLENGQVELRDQTGHLSDLLDRAVRAAGLHESPLKVSRDPASEDVTLTTDIDRLGQVFINLIANAQKYCDAKAPHLTIKVSEDDTGYLIDFIDNGSGIAPDKQDLIFEKFSRVADGSKAGGAGLGLAICREIMQRLGGEVLYLAQSRGAAFRVRLPQVKTTAALEKT